MTTTTKTSTKTPEERMTELQTEFDLRSIEVDPHDRWGGLGADIWHGQDKSQAVYQVEPAFGMLPASYESRNSYVRSAVTDPNTGEIVPIVAKFGFRIDDVDRATPIEPGERVKSWPRLLSFVTETSIEAADETILELRRANAAVRVVTGNEAITAAEVRRASYFA